MVSVTRGLARDIASGTLALLQHPDQLERLRSEPSLIQPAIEEFSRFVSPVEIATERYATLDLELFGENVRRRDLVLAVLGSANRDDRRFPQPDDLDITRTSNPHV